MDHTLYRGQQSILFAEIDEFLFILRVSDQINRHGDHNLHGGPFHSTSSLIQSIILYSATKIDPNSSWLSSLSIDHSDPLIVYIYSIYFSATTITSVGYGDVSPKNYGEVIVVILIQISGRFFINIGIVMFGYMIN